MREPTLPNFFLVGTGKAGTTSLYHYLRQHPQIFMSRIKEPCYFAAEIRPENLSPVYLRHILRQSRKSGDILGSGKQLKPAGWIVSEWEDYLRLFQDATNEAAIGEATVSYLWSKTAAENISRRLPDAKIVILLRDPSERAFSQYLHLLATGMTHCTFRQHVERSLQSRDEKMSPYHPFLEAGLYHDQVKRYLERFPRENIRIYWYEDDWRRPDQLLHDLFQFLEIDSTFRADTSQRRLQRSAPRFRYMNRVVKGFEITRAIGDLLPAKARKSVRDFLYHHGAVLKMDTEDRRFLVGYYREDILKLASLVNRDLSAWLS